MLISRIIKKIPALLLLSASPFLAEQAEAQPGPQCGLMNSSRFDVRESGSTGVTIHNVGKGYKSTSVDLMREFSLDRDDCENFVITRVRARAYRKTSEVDLDLIIDGRSQGKKKIHKSESGRDEGYAWATSDLSPGLDFRSMMFRFEGNATATVTSFQIEWERVRADRPRPPRDRDPVRPAPPHSPYPWDPVLDPYRCGLEQLTPRFERSAVVVVRDRVRNLDLDLVRMFGLQSRDCDNFEITRVTLRSSSLSRYNLSSAELLLTNRSRQRVSYGHQLIEAEQSRYNDASSVQTWSLGRFGLISGRDFDRMDLFIQGRDFADVEAVEIEYSYRPARR